MCFLLQPLPLLRSPVLKFPAGWKISPKWSLPKSSHPDRTKDVANKKDKPLLRPLEFKSNMRPAGGVRYAKPDPLVMIDGVEYTGGLDKVDPNEIESISIMKDKSAIEMYGKKQSEA